MVAINESRYNVTHISAPIDRNEITTAIHMFSESRHAMRFVTLLYGHAGRE